MKSFIESALTFTTDGLNDSAIFLNDVSDILVDRSEYLDSVTDKIIDRVEKV